MSLVLQPVTNGFLPEYKNAVSGKYPVFAGRGCLPEPEVSALFSWEQAGIPRRQAPASLVASMLHIPAGPVPGSL